MAQMSSMPAVAQRGSPHGAREPASPGKGDFRGRYGYGRPAHRPDPNAAYGFETYPLSRRP